jgi:hypothetical protein
MVFYRFNGNLMRENHIVTLGKTTIKVVAFSIFFQSKVELEKGDEEISRSFFRMFFCGFASKFFSEGVRFKNNSIL